MQARSAALDALVEGLQANRPVTVADAALMVPDHAARVRAAVAIRHEPAEEESSCAEQFDKTALLEISLMHHNRVQAENRRKRELERAEQERARQKGADHVPGAAPRLPGAVRQ